MDNQLQNQGNIKEHNMRVVLNSIMSSNQISRAGVAKKNNLNAASVTRIVTQLQKMGMVHETYRHSHGVGRKSVMLAIVSDCLYTVGIHLDDQFVKVCIVDFCRNIVASKHVELKKSSYNIEQITNLSYQIFLELLNEKGIQQGKVHAVGISIVGVVSHTKGMLLSSPQMGLSNIPVAEIFNHTFKIPVFIENDVKSILIGEKNFINLEENSNIAVLQIGSGMGAAAACNNKIVRGKQNSAGEVGHIIINPSNQIRCDCGGVGCLQTFVAEAFVVRRAKQFDNTIASYANIRTAYDAKEQWALEIISDVCSYIQIALNILINMYNPETVVVCGTFFEYFGALLPNITNWLNTKAFKPLGSSCSVVLSSHGGYSCALGASIIACDKSLNDMFRNCN